MTGGNRVTLEQVLAQVNAPPIPDAEDLLNLSLDELEGQLQELGVDVSSDLEELAAVASEGTGTPGPASLDDLDARDLDRLTLPEVEDRLRRDGVDVDGYLARAESLIRAPSSNPARGTAARSSSAGQMKPARAGRRPRRVPRALAASLAAVAVAGITYTLVRELPPEPDESWRAHAPAVALEAPPASTEAVSPTASVVVPEARAPGAQQRFDVAESAPADAPVAATSAPPVPAQPAAAPAQMADSAELERSRDKETAASQDPPRTRELARPKPERVTPAIRALRQPAPPAPPGAALHEPAGVSSAAPRERIPEARGNGSAPVPEETMALRRREAERPSRRARMAATPALESQVSDVAREASPGPASAWRDIAPGASLAGAIDELVPDRTDRQTLRRLLAGESGPGRLSVRIEGAAVVALEFAPPTAAPVRVLRDPSGRLRRAPGG